MTHKAPTPLPEIIDKPATPPPPPPPKKGANMSEAKQTMKEKCEQEAAERDRQLAYERSFSDAHYEAAKPASEAKAAARIGNSWEFVCSWYGVDEIHGSIRRQQYHSFEHQKLVPTDIYSREFAEWLTDQYRLAMNKGIQLARDEAKQSTAATHSELEQLRERVRELESYKKWTDQAYGDLFDAVLIACSGIVCTPEKGYREDGGVCGAIADLKAARRKHDADLTTASQRIVELETRADELECTLSDEEASHQETLVQLTAANEKCERLERGIAKLDKHCLNGHYCKWQDGVLWLFDSRGEGVEMAASRLELINKLGGES